MRNKTLIFNYLLLVGAILAWAFSWPVGKIGLEYISPLWYSAIRVGIGAFTILLVVAALGKISIPKREDLWLIVGIGIFQIGLCILFITWGLSRVNAGQSAVLAYTTPIWVTPLAYFLFKERITNLQLIGVLLGTFGILIIFNPFSLNWHDSGLLLGNGFLVLGSISLSIAILIARYSKWHSTPLELMFWQLLLGFILIFITAIFLDPNPRIIVNASLIYSLLYAGMIATAFGYWGAVVVSKELSPNNVSVSLLTIPIISLITSSIFLHEKVTTQLMLATVFILLGLGVIIYSNVREFKRNLNSSQRKIPITLEADGD